MEYFVNNDKFTSIDNHYELTAVIKTIQQQISDRTRICQQEQLLNEVTLLIWLHDMDRFIFNDYKDMENYLFLRQRIPELYYPVNIPLQSDIHYLVESIAK